MVMTTLAMFLQLIAQHSAAERIHEAQYAAAVEARAQHREVKCVQPVSRLTPAEEAANRKAELDRLVTPAAVRREIQ